MNQYQIGHTETKEVKNKRIASLVLSWKNRNDYIADIKHPYIYNVWRSIKFTLKGRKIGCDPIWDNYRTFYNDVSPTYIEGYRFHRLNKKIPNGPNNFIWVPDEAIVILKDKAIILTYNNESLTLREWADKLGVSFNGIRDRYYKHKNYTPEEILLGKGRKHLRPKLNAKELSYQKLRNKASKMCSSYKNKDRRMRYDFNLNADWLIKNILFKKCTYCGTSDNVGCDRIDNNKGHTKDNVLPCCYVCNTVRGNNFTVDEMKQLGKCISNINENRLK